MSKRDYFNSLAPQWDALPHPPDTPARVARFCDAALPEGARRVLDVGCGTGLLIPYALRRSPEARIVALDYAVAMLREAAGKWHDERLRAVCADALDAPFPDASFDAVLCFGILPHLGDTGRAVGALWRLVRPAGVLAVGHLMGSTELNDLHADIGPPVANDRLVPATELERLLRSMGADAVEAEDSPDRYFVRASRGA